MEMIRNTRRRDLTELPANEFVGVDAPHRVRLFLNLCPKYQSTPLYQCDGLARLLGVHQIFVKDESQRLGLQSFKALGGIYAIFELLSRAAARRLGRPVEPSQLLSPQILSIGREMTFVCASDGNHGRSVAAGARLVGAQCVVYLHSGVSEQRARWIATLGASVVRFDGTYDESVVAAQEAARRKGWTLVADTGITADDEVPGLIMRGYTVIADEMIEQFADRRTFPTHFFVQAGVGGLAAATLGHFAARLGRNAPISVVVEPESSRCLLESCRNGEVTEVPHTAPTIYAMLECNRPSPLAWQILDPTADFFVSIDDSLAVPAMRALANPIAGDPTVVAGESGIASFAALNWACLNAAARSTLSLGSNSVVAVINTEGATDPLRYRELVGADPIRDHIAD